MVHLRDLYQEVILDHYRNPRNFGPLEEANRQAEGFNPLCGDKVTIYLKLEGGVVKDIHFEGSGCAISTASASLMTESLKGRSRVEIEAFYHGFHALVMGRSGGAGEEDLGKLAVFQGVSEYPVRVKCATLTWHTLKAALDDKAGAVSTE